MLPGVFGYRLKKIYPLFGRVSSPSCLNLDNVFSCVKRTNISPLPLMKAFALLALCLIKNVNNTTRHSKHVPLRTSKGSRTFKL